MTNYPCHSGHKWIHVGGSGCGCACENCSAPVHVCEICGDCDYADNEDAVAIRAECAIVTALDKLIS